MTSTSVKSISSMMELEEIVTKTMQNGKLLVLMFTAAWSEVCKFMKPKVQDIVSRFRNVAEFYTLDVDKFKQITEHLRVEALPTFVLVMKGRVRDRVVGVDVEKMESSIQKHTGKVVKNIDSESDRWSSGTPGARAPQERKGEMTATTVMAIKNDTELREVFSKTSFKLLVLVFMASWSEPCKYMMTMLEDIASRFKNNAEFYTIDIDKFKQYQYVRYLEAEVLPTFLLVKNRTVEGRVTGINMRELESSIQKHIKTSKVEDSIFGGNNQELESRIQKHIGTSKVEDSIFGAKNQERKSSIQKQHTGTSKVGGDNQKPESSIVPKDTDANKVDDRVTGANRDKLEGSIEKHAGVSKVEDRVNGANKGKLDGSIKKHTDAEKDGRDGSIQRHTGDGVAGGEPARLTLKFFSQEQPEAGATIGERRSSRKPLSAIWAWVSGRS